MKRREFLSSLGAAAAAGFRARGSWAQDLPGDLRITRIVGFDLPSKRDKVAGKNSRLDVHRDRGNDRMVRLYTNAGIEGLGNCRAGEAALASLLGRNPLEWFRPAETAMQSPLRPGTMPLWDLAGKVLKKPVWALLGGKGPERVPAYDGSIYFADLLPQYDGRWEDRFKEEIDMGLRRGHRAFKVKIGRGAKWMPAEEGFERDKAVVRAIRRHAGPKIALGVDANNGYDLARTKRLIEELPGADLAFVEEPFEEQIEQDLELKAFIRERGLRTLIADGETQATVDLCRPFLEARAIDIYQGDMNRFGIEGVLTAAAWAKPQGLAVAPHNWGSLVGFYMMLHVGRAITNFYRAENDPLETDILTAGGYSIKDGLASVPDAPGFGLGIDENRFAAAIKPRFDLKA